MSKIEIGQSFQANGKNYKIIGTEKRSFILESEGKKFVATAAKIEKIIAQMNQASVKYPNLERRVKYRQIFIKDAKMPQTEEECLAYFISLTGELSGENLACDGEASPSQIRQKLKSINATWKELESIVGRTVTEDEINEKQIKGINDDRVK